MKRKFSLPMTMALLGLALLLPPSASAARQTLARALVPNKDQPHAEIRLQIEGMRWCCKL